MAFTKVVGAGIHTLSNITSHNINSSGIITATKFVGPFDGSDGNFSGNVTIDGNLTVNGTTTTLDTLLTEVDKLEIAANNSTVGAAITQSGSGDILNLYDGSTEVFSVADGGTVSVLATGDNKGLRIHTNSGVSATNNELRFNTGQSSGFTFMTNSDGTSSNERLRITSTGQIITNGNASPFPTRGLTVRPNSGQTNNYISIIAGNTSSVSGVTFGTSADNNANNYRAMFEYYHSGFAHHEGLRFLAAGTEAFRIRGGASNAGDILYGSGDHVIGASPGLLNGLGSHNNANVASVLYGIDDGGGYNGMKVINFDDGTYNSQKIQFLTGKGGVSMATVRATIDENGKVGIGTDNPLTGLHISDGTAYGSPQITNRKAQLMISAGSEISADIQLSAAQYNHIFFGTAADPNVGGINYTHTGGYTNSMQFVLGTGSVMFRPTASVDIKSQTAQGNSFLQSINIKDSGDVTQWQLGMYQNNTQHLFLNNHKSNIIVSHASLDHVSFASDGKVGIGTNLITPSFKLDVREAHAVAYAANATSAQLAIGNINSSANTNSSGIHMYSDGNGRGVVNLNCLNNSTNASADFTIQTRHNGTLGERFRILSDGRIRGGSQTTNQPGATYGGFQFDASGGYLRISKGGGATGTSGAGMQLLGGGSNTNHLATASWGSNIYLINTNQVDNNANCIAFANKNSLASSFIIGKNDSHANRNGSLIFATSHGAAPTQRMRITKEGSINIGTNSTQSTHMLYMQGTGDVGIHLRADTDNSGENDNPYISMAQDSGNTQQFKLGMAGDPNTAFNMQLANSPFIHANNANSQPLQLAHMSNMVVTLSSVPTLSATGQSATDPRDFDSNGSLAGNSVGGLKIHHYGNDTAAALMLSGHNNSGTPGVETRTQLTHTGANLRFHIEHHGYEAFNIGPTGNIYLKNCSTIPSFTTSYNVSAISLKGGSLMNYQENNIYLLQNVHYDGAWRNTYAGGGGYVSIGSGRLDHYYYADQGSANQSINSELIRNVSFYKNNSAGASLNQGNRPSAQGQIVIWGHSNQTTAGGLEFHSSGGGGAGYGGKITCDTDGRVQIHTRNNNSAWSTKFTVSGTSNEAQASNFGTGGYYRSSGPGGGAGIKLQGLAAGSGNNWVDTGISVNQGNASATMLVIGSRNTGSATHVQGYAWLLRFQYNGNYLPSSHPITGNSDFWSIRVSSSNTLEINGNSGNWQFGGIWTT